MKGLLHWLWVFATATTTVYCIRAGRGFRDAASVLGADFAGGLGRDGWAPYRQFTEAFHQTCLGQYANFQNMPIPALSAHHSCDRADVIGIIPS